MNFLVYYKIDVDEDEGLSKKIMSGGELIKLIDESDYTQVEIVKIMAIDDPENIFEVRYAGWQPGCVIELVNNTNNVVYRGYGTDH